MMAKPTNKSKKRYEINLGVTDFIKRQANERKAFTDLSAVEAHMEWRYSNDCEICIKL